MPQVYVPPGGTPYIRGVTKKLYLDDIRTPSLLIDCWDARQLIKVNDPGWDIVRSYDEFVAYIEENGVPEMISFDADLAAVHYTSFTYEGPEKDGVACAKYIIDNNLPIHYWSCHSMNPIKREKIISLLKDYESRTRDNTA